MKGKDADVRIDLDLCIQCERCREVCPTRVADQACTFAVDRVTDGMNIACIRCGHCMAVCPTKAFQVEGLDYKDMPEAQDHSPVSQADMIAYVKNRRSIRNFTDELLSDQTIQELLDVVQFAASGHNQHKCRWGVVKGKERIRAMADQVIAAIENDPFYADFVQAYRKGKNSLTRDASHLIFVYMPTNALVPVEDGTVAMEVLEMILPSFGLGGCWGGYMTILGNQNQQVRELLRVPESHKIVGTMLLGYPDGVERYLRIPPRGSAQVEFFGE